MAPASSRTRHGFLRSVYVWTWLGVVFSVAVCLTLGWLRYEQSRVLRETDELQNHLSQARIDFNKGFLDVMLAGDEQSSFHLGEGMALINQALATIKDAGGAPGHDFLSELQQPATLADFEKLAGAFQANLQAWSRRGNNPADGLQLNLHVQFHELERHALQIDLANHARFDGLRRRLDFEFVTAIAISAMLLCGICLGIYWSGSRQGAALQALELSEEHLRTVGDNLPDGYIYRFLRCADGRARFTFVSAGVERLHGLTVEECLRDASSLLLQIDPLQAGEYAAAEAKSARELTDFEMDLRFQPAQGQARIVHVRSHPMVTATGEISWDGVVMDITKNRQAEESQRKNELLLRQMGSTAKVGGWELDIATGKGEWTEEVARIHDLDPALPPDMKLGLSFYRGESQTRIQAVVHAAITTGQPYDLELELVSAKGVHKWVRTIGQPVMENGKIVRLRGSFQDITAFKQAEMTLREREHQLRLFVEHGPAAVAMLDTDMRYLVASRRWIEDYKPAITDVIGRSHYEVFPEISENWKAVHRRCLAGAVEKSDADAFPRADGRVDWVRWEIVPWRKDDNSIGGLIIFSEVITQQKEAEEIIRQQQQNYQEIFNSSNDAIFLHDAATGRILDVNDAMLRMHGYASREEFMAGGPERAFLEVPPFTWVEASRRIRLAVEQGPQVFEWLNCNRTTGERFWVEVSLRSSQIGGEGRVLAVVRDISERKRAEAALRLSEEQFRAMFEMASIGIAQTNPVTGELLRVNRKLCEIIGYTEAELLRKRVTDISHPEDRDWSWNLFQAAVRGETPSYHIEKRFIRRDNSIAWVSINMTVQRDSFGQPNRTLATIEDITERRHLELQLRQSQKLEAIGQLAGGVAHDFNNILTSILMQVELGYMEDNLPAAITDGLKQIRDDAQRAASLTRQLLLFSRRQIMQSRDVDINDIVINLAKMLQRIIGEDVRLVLHLAPGKLQTRADAGMLDQVLMNLSVNARDAMPEGGELQITTSDVVVDAAMAKNYPDAQPGRFICLAVTDTGSGIPPEVIPRIFEPFFTTKEAGKGTGLGLATVFGIVKQHNGWLAVESQVGTGTTFKIYVPMLAVSEGPVAAASRTVPKGGTETILVVEDEADVRSGLRIILSRNGYQIVEAANGVEALRLWSDKLSQVELLITDMVMPGGISGTQLARRLAEQKPGLKIIYVSGYSAEIAGKELNLRSTEVFLQKPFHPENLLKAVRKSLDGD